MVLTVGVNQIVVETHFVLLEIGDRCVIDLQHQRADVHIIALNLLVNCLDLSSKVSYRVHDRVLGLENSF